MTGSNGGNFTSVRNSVFWCITKVSCVIADLFCILRKYLYIAVHAVFVYSSVVYFVHLYGKLQLATLNLET